MTDHDPILPRYGVGKALDNHLLYVDKSIIVLLYNGWLQDSDTGHMRSGHRTASVCAHLQDRKGPYGRRIIGCRCDIPDMSLTAVHGIMLAFIPRLEYARPGIEVSSAIGERWSDYCILPVRQKILMRE